MHRWAFSACLLLGGSLLLWSSMATGYDTYHPQTANDGCFQCHSGFDGKGPLHDLHVGSSQMTNNCDLCHVQRGDNPLIGGPSGADPEHACTGCHEPTGLRLHHAEAGAPPDAFGLFCVTCHPADPPPPGEGTPPPFYGRADVDVNEPCLVEPGNGGEDWDGDGHGLDNDGDLDYESNDSDCVQTGIEEGMLQPPRVLSMLIAPNPVTTRAAEIWYGLPVRSDVVIEVVDVAGRRILERNLFEVSPGWHRTHFEGRDQQGRRLASGVYLVRVLGANQSKQQRIVFLP